MSEVDAGTHRSSAPAFTSFSGFTSTSLSPCGNLVPSVPGSSVSYSLLGDTLGNWLFANFPEEKDAGLQEATGLNWNQYESHIVIV